MRDRAGIAYELPFLAEFPYYLTILVLAVHLLLDELNASPFRFLRRKRSVPLPDACFIDGVKRYIPVPAGYVEGVCRALYGYASQRRVDDKDSPASTVSCMSSPVIDPWLYASAFSAPSRLRKIIIFPPFRLPEHSAPLQRLFKIADSRQAL